MKLSKLALLMTTIGVASITLPSFAEWGKDMNLTLNQFVTQFTVTPGASAPTVAPAGTGTWNAGAPITIESSAICFDNDAATSNQFAVTTRTSDPAVTTTIDMLVSAVPEASRGTPDAGVQAAFCVVEGSSRYFALYVGGAWKTLTGATVPANNQVLKVLLSFDYKNGKYVKASVLSGTTSVVMNDLEDASHNMWFAMGKDLTGIKEYCFVGDGLVKSFTTAQASLQSAAVDPINDPSVPEESPIKDKKVVVPADQSKAIDAARGTMTAAAYLAQDAKNIATSVPSNLNVAEALALGLVKAKSDGSGLEAAADTSVKLKGNALDTGSDIAIGIPSINKPEGSNAEIKYTLRGSKNGTDFVDVGTPSDTVPSINPELIGTGEGEYLYFKVKVSVTFPTPN